MKLNKSVSTLDMDNEKVCMWIIRFTDGTLASCYGTAQKSQRPGRRKERPLRRRIHHYIKRPVHGNVRARGFTSSGITPTKTIPSRGRKVKKMREKSRFYF